HKLTMTPLKPLRSAPSDLKSLNPAFVRFTSGTTATAKGVVLSHQTIAERIDAANEALRLTADDRIVWLLSMAYHFTVSIVSYLSIGAAIILPKRNLADSVLDSIKRYQGTVLYGSPQHYAWLAYYPTASSIASLRLAISTTAPLDCFTASAFQKI